MPRILATTRGVRRCYPDFTDGEMEAERTQGFITFPGTSILSAVHAPPPNPHSSSGRTVQQSAYFSYEKTEALEVRSLMKVAQQNRASNSSSLRLTPHRAPAGRDDLTCQALGANCFRGGLFLPLCNPSKGGWSTQTVQVSWAWSGTA